MRSSKTVKFSRISGLRKKVQAGDLKKSAGRRASEEATAGRVGLAKSARARDRDPEPASSYAGEVFAVPCDQRAERPEASVVAIASGPVSKLEQSE